MKKAFRILGSVIISLVGAIYLFIMVGSLFEGEKITIDFEGLGIVILSLLTIVSAVWVWVKPRTGAWVALVVGVLFSIFGLVTAGQNRWMAVVAAGGPVVLGSILALIGIRSTPEEG
jgi:hypothetical protein